MILKQRNKTKQMKCAVYLDDFCVTENPHVDAVDVDQNVALGQIFAARPVQDGLDFLAVRAVGDREPKAHGAFRDLHRQELDFAARRRHDAGSVHHSVPVLVPC